MTGTFDTNGDLWIEVVAGTQRGEIPSQLFGVSKLRASDTGNMAFAVAVTGFNLTGYVRHLQQPNWLNAALTSTSANLAVEAKDWLATIPDPIEPKDAA